MMSGSFVTLDTVVSRILLEIGDEEHKRYRVRATQWALDAFRRINTSYSPFYLERRADLDEVNAVEYPKDMVKLLSVGVYKGGKFVPLIRRPDLTLLPPDVTDNIHVPEASEQVSLPGWEGRSGRSVYGYWSDDPEHSRLFIRNFRYDPALGGFSDNTRDVASRLVIRYKTTGLNCSGDICIPETAQDFVVAYVNYKFAVKGIPVRLTADEKDRIERELNSIQESYETIMYEPHNLSEVADAIFGSLNIMQRDE